MIRKYEYSPPVEEKDEQRATVVGKKQADAYKPHAMEEQEEWQHMLGNTAIRRIMRAVASAGNGPLLPREKKESGYARWLLPRLAARGQDDVLRRFYALTMPQKRAVLRNTLGKYELEQERYAVNQERFEQQVDALKHVELRQREAEREADERERGADHPYRNLHEDGLLSPYREIVRWLHYKANKQGKAALMQRFAAFSTAHKQLAIHRMIKFEKLSIRAFTRKLNVSVMEREWVDWTAVESGMNGAERMLAKHKAAEGGEDHRSEMVKSSSTRQREDEEAGDLSSLPASLLSLLGLAGSRGAAGQAEANNETAASPERQTTLAAPAAGGATAAERGAAADKESTVAHLATRDNAFWGRLLLGAASAVALHTMIEQYRRNKSDTREVVDRYLQLDRIQPALRSKRRSQRLKTAGFSSVDACFQFLLRGFAAYLARGAAQGKDPEFRKALRLLAIADGSDEQTTIEQIVRKLAKR